MVHRASAKEIKEGKGRGLKSSGKRLGVVRGPQFIRLKLWKRCEYRTWENMWDANEK